MFYKLGSQGGVLSALVRCAASAFAKSQIDVSEQPESVDMDMDISVGVAFVEATTPVATSTGIALADAEVNVPNLQWVEGIFSLVIAVVSLPSGAGEYICC